MTRTRERAVTAVAAVLAFAAIWWLHHRTVTDAVDKVRDEFLTISQEKGLYRIEGMARDDAHEAQLADHERRLEALEERE